MAWLNKVVVVSTSMRVDSMHGRTRRSLRIAMRRPAGDSNWGKVVQQWVG